MSTYQVGSLYHPDRTHWPEVAQYNYRGGEHELTIFLERPRTKELEAARVGAADFALIASPPVLLLCYRFGDGLPWSDAPYSWHLVPDAERTLPPEPELAERALLHVVVVDAATGIIRVLRALTLAPEFSRALHRAIRAQSRIPWSSHAFDRELSLLQRSTSAELAGRADVRCRGGA